MLFIYPPSHTIILTFEAQQLQGQYVRCVKCLHLRVLFEVAALDASPCRAAGVLVTDQILKFMPVDRCVKHEKWDPASTFKA